MPNVPLVAWLGVAVGGLGGLGFTSTALAADVPAPGVPRAESLLRHGDLPGALAAVTEAVRARPSDVAAEELYIDLLVGTGNAPRALAEMQAYATAHPTSADARYLLGRASPDAAGSRAAYDAALKLDPSHARSLMGLGSVHEALGEFGPAETAYGRAVALDPALAEAWIGRVRTLAKAGRNADALTQARAGWQAVPGEASLALVLAEMVPADAATVLATSLARTPDDPRLHEALAEQKLESGDAPGALKAARNALSIDPTSLDAGRVEIVAREIADGRLDQAGWTSFDAARRKEITDPGAALAAYRSLAPRYPSSSLVMLRIGTVRRAIGERAGVEDMLAAVKLDPTSVEAAGAAGLALVEDGRLTEAEPLLTRAAAARPWDSTLGLARVRAVALTGRTDEAHALAAELLRRFPSDPGVVTTQAGFLCDAGQPEDAYTLVKRGLVDVPDPRLAAAFVRIAPLAGHPNEAAALLEQIVAKTGNQALADAARKLRATAGTPVGVPPP